MSPDRSNARGLFYIYSKTKHMAVIPIFKALVTDDGEGINKVSLVDFPAVESNWIACKKEKEPLKFKVEDEEKRLITGVVMRADFAIYRRTDDGFEYYIVYDKETIKTMAQKLLTDNAQNNINLMHEDGTDVEGVNMIELFIKDSDKGISPAGFDEIEEGSLFATYHVENDEIWEQVKDGTFKGFSLEGYFTLEPTDDFIKMQNNKAKNTNSKMSKIKGILKSLLAEFGSIDTNKGVLDYEGELEVGAEVKINDEVAADGEYETEDKIIVVADGKITEIRDKEAQEEPAEEPKAESEAFAKFKKVAQAYSETYAEKERKIYDAIKNATGVEYFWLVEAADDYAVYSIWVDDKDKYFRVALTWDEEGNVIVGEISEVEPAFVEKKEDEPATEVVEMAEEPKADEPAEEPAEEPKAEDEPAERDLAAEIDAIKAEIETLKATIAEIKGEPANEPIAEQFEAISTPDKTGNRSLDKAIKRFSYLKK